MMGEGSLYKEVKSRPELLSSHWAEWMTLGLACLLAVLIFLQPTRVHMDVGLYLEVGELLLQGHTPYVDYWETNPPLIHYLNILPAWLATVLPYPVTMVFMGLLWACTLGVAAWVRHLLIRAGRKGEGNWAALGVLFATCQMWFLNIHGQREHLFALFFLPYAVFRMLEKDPRRLIGVGERIAIGFIAGLGLFIKPHFVVVLLLLEVGVWIQTRTLRRLSSVELGALCGTGVLYVGHFFLMPNGMAEAFWSRWVPYVWYGYATTSKAPWGALFMENANILVYLFAVLVLFAMAYRRRPSAQLLGLGACVVGGVCSFIAQQKGWTYHLSAALFFAAVGCVLLMGERCTSKWARRGSLAIVGTIALAWAWGVSTERYEEPGHITLMKQHAAAGDPVLVLSSNVANIHPFVSIYGWQMLPGYPFSPVPNYQTRHSIDDLDAGVVAWMEQEETVYVGTTQRELQTLKPVVIAVETGPCWSCAETFRFSDWVLTNPLGALLQREYRLESSAYGFDLYIRKPDLR